MALIAAVITSAGQLLVLQAAGIFAPAATPTVVNGQPVGQRTVQLTEESAVIQSAAAVSPAVVTITSHSAATTDSGAAPSSTSDPFSQPTTGIGSGIIYDAAGWILTNRHVVAGSDTVTVKLKDGREFQGTTYGIDTLTDLAIVKIEGADLPVAPLGDSTTLQIGQLAIAIGSPLGDFDEQRHGWRHQRHRPIDRRQRRGDAASHDGCATSSRPTPPSTPATPAGHWSTRWARSSASTRPSPAARRASASPSPSRSPSRCMKQAIAGEKLSRPYIGISYQAVTPQLKRQANLPIDYGAWVAGDSGGAGVRAGGPAATAGLKDDDIITAIDGQRIDAGHSLEDVLVRLQARRSDHANRAA